VTTYFVDDAVELHH